MSVITICNMTASFNLGKKVDLESFVSSNPEARMAKGGFDQAIWKMDKKNCTALIYKSGKVVLVGSKSRKSCKCIAKHMRNTIGDGNEEKCHVKFYNFVGSSAFAHAIRLADFVTWCQSQPSHFFEHWIRVTHDPELFPGANFFVSGLGSTVVLFASGKYFITGCKTKDDLVQSNRFIENVLEEYKKYCNFICSTRISLLTGGKVY